MPKQKTDDLIQLIRSLTRAEKRHFRLFVKRNQQSDNILFLQLFDFLEKSKVYQESAILVKLSGIKKSQLSNLKAHLYKQLLTSLRLLNKNYALEIQLREAIDHAKVLYDKGVYRQSLDLLDKAKQKAMAGEFLPIAMEILDFEKHIESQYITRSIEGRAEALTSEAVMVHQRLGKRLQFSNLSLKLYGLYLTKGYVKSENEFLDLKQYFDRNVPNIPLEDLDLLGKMHYHQSYLWYYHMAQDFPKCYRHAKNWVHLFKEHAPLLENYPALYLKAIHNLLSTLFYLGKNDEFLLVFEDLKKLQEVGKVIATRNIEGLYNLYLYIHAINSHYIQGTFTEGVQLIPELEAIIRGEEFNWDKHRVMVFYYRIACLLFGSGDYGQTIVYLNKIINSKNPDYRADIQCFARILSLIAHFELGNDQLLEYQIISVYRFLSKMQELGAVHREIFSFLRKIPTMEKKGLGLQFALLHDKLEKLAHHPYEKRAFLYLDIISWLESKIQNRLVQDVIQEKFNLSRQNQFDPGTL